MDFDKFLTLQVDRDSNSGDCAAKVKKKSRFSMQITRADYVGSYASVKGMPTLRLPEYAFIGRSNVGKSSLINMLTHRKDLAHVSNQPGKTRTVNLYDIDSQWILADLPGYGYAQVAKSMRSAWAGLIMEYLTQRTNLMCVFVLLDFRLPLQKLDREILQQLGEHEIPFVLVYTKTDKVTPGKRNSHAKQIENALLEDWSELPARFYTSSAVKSGRDELLQYIERLNSLANAEE